MAIFTKKSPIMEENAQIGELIDNGDIIWAIADFQYAWSMYLGGVLEHRGSRTVNGITYTLFYLPPPAHSYHSEA